MPHINSRGDFTHGVGGGFVNLNNVALFPGAVIGWMDDDSIACADGEGVPPDVPGSVWPAAKYHVPSGTKAMLSDPPTGANSGYAGGGQATWFWAANDPQRGLNSTTGFSGVDLGPMAMGPDASLAYRLYHSHGPGEPKAPTIVRELDGSEWELTTGDAFAVQLLGQGLALWMERSDYTRLFVRGLPQPETVGARVDFPRAFFLHGRWWLGYQSETHGTIAHPFDDPTQGYRFVAAGVDAWPMFRALADGRLCCVWSNHIDEQAGRMTRVIKDVVTDPFEPLEPSLPPIESVPLLNRSFGLACYCFNDVRTIGNIELPIRPSSLPQQDVPIIATTDDEISVEDADLWAIYSGESSDVPAEEAIQEARIVGHRRQRGLSIYQDSFPMRLSVYEQAIDEDVLAPQCYRSAGETLDAYIDRVNKEYRELSQLFETWPTVNIHNRSGTLSTRDVVEGFVAATQLAEAQHWPGMHLFRIGTSDVPDEIYPYVERFMSGITGTPDARVLDDPDQPDEPDLPEPEEPQPMNVYLLVTPAAAPSPNKVPTPGTTKLLGVRENLPDGGFAIRKPNGKYATLTPGRVWEERDTVQGEWEKFYDGKPGFILAPKRDDQCFTLEAVQGP